MDGSLLSADSSSTSPSGVRPEVLELLSMVNSVLLRYLVMLGIVGEVGGIAMSNSRSDDGDDG